MGECRNCGREETKDLGFIGDVAPFFLKRVMGLECGFAPSTHPIKRTLRKLNILYKPFEKIYGKSVLTEMQSCRACSFIQTRRPFDENAIANLYSDYRSDSYNQERIRYEPEYASLAPHVGKSAREIESRKTRLTQWLKGKIDSTGSLSMLDYGGADGMFLPDLPGQRCVFDISEIEPVHGITKINSESELGSYTYIQLAHVLEHVPFPLALTKKAASFLDKSGLLYIEVPQDLDEPTRTNLETGDGLRRIPIHEHINQYCPRAVMELLKSAGLSPITVESEIIDLGWIKGTIVRALGRR